MSIAIIPARAGSKRIVKKNTRDFLGVPMIQRTISKAMESNLFEEIFVTTEDVEISELAISSGAKLLKRPSFLSDDFATTIDVLSHAVELLSKESYPGVVTCIYPVTPLLDYRHIKKGLDIVSEYNRGFVFSAQEFESPIERSFELDSSDKVLDLNSLNISKRTQDFMPRYRDAGQFYIGSKELWISKLPLISRDSKCVKIPKYETVDIDTPEDWDFAEQLFLSRLPHA